MQANYAYNALGQQAVRTFPGSGQSIHSVYGPDDNRIAELDGGTGALIREYVWLDGAPVAVIEGGQVYLIRSDHIGRPTFATTMAGTVVWTASYLPFGGVHIITGAPIEARFPGQWFQAESGLHQNWMRDYDPTTGRYIEADPLGLVDGASVYGYARQNPGRWTDPRGEQTASQALRSPAARMLSLAGVCAAVDGPLPVGDIVALGIAVYALTASEACGCEDDCPYEMPLSELGKPGRGKMEQIINLVGHPHDLKDDSKEDIYYNKRTGCVYVGAKNGKGMGRLVGKI